MTRSIVEPSARPGPDTAPVIGGAIVVTTNFSTIFYSTGVAAFAISAALPRPVGDSGDLNDDDDLSLAGCLAVFRQRDLLPWYAATVVNMFLVGILFGFLPVRLHALGYSPLASGALLTVVSAAYVAIQPAAGALADRVNAELTIRATLAAAATIVMALTSGTVLIVAAVAAGLGVGVVWTNTDTLISTLAARQRLGAAIGAAGSFKELGDMTGPLLVGVLSQAFGLTTGFLVCGVLALACLPLLRHVR